MRTLARITRTGVAALAVIALFALVDRPARAAGTPLAEPMRRLQTLCEDTLRWIILGDTAAIQHASIELVRATALSVGIAPSLGLPPNTVDLLNDLGAHAEKMGEEAQKGDLKDAAEEYLEMIEVCMKCHVGR